MTFSESVDAPKIASSNVINPPAIEEPVPKFAKPEQQAPVTQYKKFVPLGGWNAVDLARMQQDKVVPIPAFGTEIRLSNSNYPGAYEKSILVRQPGQDWHETSLSQRRDPVVGDSAVGDFYDAVVLGRNAYAVGNFQDTGLQIYSSRDGGVNWELRLNLPGNQSVPSHLALTETAKQLDAAK